MDFLQDFPNRLLSRVLLFALVAVALFELHALPSFELVWPRMQQHYDPLMLHRRLARPEFVVLRPTALWLL